MIEDRRNVSSRGNRRLVFGENLLSLVDREHGLSGKTESHRKTICLVAVGKH